MKILACVDVGSNKIIQEWDAEEKHLIIRRFDSDSEAIAIPLDASRIKVTSKPEDLKKKLENTPQQEEHIEAFVHSIECTYLGTLNLADAVLLRFQNSN